MKKLMMLAVAGLALTACEDNGGNPGNDTARTLVERGMSSGWPRMTSASQCHSNNEPEFWYGLGETRNSQEINAFYSANGYTRGPRSIATVVETMFAGGRLSDADKKELTCIVVVPDERGYRG